MSSKFALVATLLSFFLLFSVIDAAEFYRPWRNILSSRINKFAARAPGDFDADATFKKVQASCPQPDVNNAGQQMINMANAASEAMDDLVNGRQNDKALNMYNSIFGVEPDDVLKTGYYKIVKGVFDSIAAFSNSGSNWVLYCDEKWATYHPFSTTDPDENDKTKLGYWTAKDPTEFSKDVHFDGGVTGVCSAGDFAWTLHGPNVIQLCPMLFNKGVIGTLSPNTPVTIPQDVVYGAGQKRIDQMNSVASTFLHEMAHQVKDTIDDVPAIRNDGTKAGETLKDRFGNILALGLRTTKSYGWKYVYNLSRFDKPGARQNADSYMNFAIGVYYTGNDWSTGKAR